MSSEVPMFLFTFNCGKHAKDIIYTDEENPSYANFVDNVYESLPGVKGGPLNTLYVFGFQELCSIIDGLFPQFVGGYLTRLRDTLVDLLKTKYGYEVDFHTVGISHIGAIGLIVLTPFKDRVTKVRSAGSSCGHFYSSLKGACGLRFELLPQDSKNISYENPDSLSGSTFTIVSAHLNANEGEKNWKRRNQDLITLFRSLDFEDGWGILSPKAHCFIVGDLNYRASENIFTRGLKSRITTINGSNSADSSRNDSSLLFLEPTDTGAEDPLAGTIEKDFASIDELTISRLENEAFWGFEEGKITFRPTYKFFEQQNEYNPKRIPSWCDRILYQSYKEDTVSSSLSSLGSSSSVNLPGSTRDRELTSTHKEAKVVKYGSIPAITLSDHKPVYLHVKVPLYPPMEAVIGKDGRLVRESPYGALYLRPTLYDKVVRNVTYITDCAIGWGLYGFTSTKGRAVLLGLALFILYGYLNIISV